MGTILIIKKKTKRTEFSMLDLNIKEGIYLFERVILNSFIMRE